MKVHMRDRFAAMLGAGLLGVLVAASYYYATKAGIDALKSATNQDSPDFTTTKIAITEFDSDGTASGRFFAEYAEHFEDGRMTSVRPVAVTLYADRPQTRASADTGTSTDDGESVLFSGNVTVTREGTRTSAPMRFTTPFITVYPDTSRMQTTAPVRMERGTELTTGVGAALDNVERTVQIFNDVHTFGMPPESKEVKE